MKIKVNPHNVEIIREQTEPINEKEIKISKCEFEFDDKITNDFVKEAYFTLNGETYKQIIQNNECEYPSEVLDKKGTLEIGVVAYKVENEQEIQRYNPSPDYFESWVGSLKDAENSEPITPSEMEQFEQQLQDGLNDIQDAIENAERLDIDANKVGKITSITITKQDGTTKTVTLEDGQDGISLENIEIVNRNLKVTYGGETENLGQVAPNIQVGTTTTGLPNTNASVVNVGTDLNPILNFTIPKGEAGSIKFEIVEQLPTQDIKEDTIYLVPYTKITVQSLPTENIQLHTIYIVESTGKRYVYNGNEWIEISNDNQYIEYVYINNSWEELGSIGVDINLDDYYTKTETNNLLATKQALITNNNKLSASLVSGLSNVATSGSYNDLSNKPNLSVYQTTANLITSISSSSTDTQYPSAKCVYDLVGNLETILTTLDIGAGV